MKVHAVEVVILKKPSVLERRKVKTEIAQATITLRVLQKLIKYRSLRVKILQIIKMRTVIPRKKKKRNILGLEAPDIFIQMHLIRPLTLQCFSL